MYWCIVPLYVKIEKKFLEDVEMPELKRRKDELKKIREMRGKQVNEEELKEHEKAYESVLRKRMAELEEERMRKVANGDYDPSKYKTKFNQKVYEEEMIKRRELELKAREKEEAFRKRFSYGEFVNKVHKPVVSIK